MKQYYPKAVLRKEMPEDKVHFTILANDQNLDVKTFKVVSDDPQVKKIGFAKTICSKLRHNDLQKLLSLVKQKGIEFITTCEAELILLTNAKIPEETGMLITPRVRATDIQTAILEVLAKYGRIRIDETNPRIRGHVFAIETFDFDIFGDNELNIYSAKEHVHHTYLRNIIEDIEAQNLFKDFEWTGVGELSARFKEFR